MSKQALWDPEGFYFLPLGGSEQFGANLNLYICNNELLAIDCGIGFADEYFPGIDLLFPDPSLIEKNKEKLKGMVITHAHEDHIGAVAYLWNKIKCPLYCTEFTAAVLKKKLEEQNIDDYSLTILDFLKPYSIGIYNIRALPVSHSVPDTCSLEIEAQNKVILHSGDWNLDPKPIIGEKTKEEVFKEIGKKKVWAYIGDSTNAEVPGRAGSESEVEKGLAREFKECNGRILVTLFSSNIGRIVSIARAAQETGRSIGVVGRSLHRMIGAARECGYLNDIDEFITEQDIGLVPDDKIVILATGSQGEPRAALPKIARGEHRSIHLKPGDSVIFSARSIPGNETKINAVKNNLSAAGINIISPRDTKNTIHVSGHPCQDEIVDMLSWLKPQTVIPVHGEHTQLQAHADLAKSQQIKNVLVPKNGSLIDLNAKPPQIIDHVETNLLALHQKRIISADHASISSRRKLQYTGAIHVSIALDHEGNVINQPKIETIGLIDNQDEQEKDFELDLIEEMLCVLDDMKDDDVLQDNMVEEEIRIALRRYVFHIMHIKPKTTVHVLRI